MAVRKQVVVGASGLLEQLQSGDSVTSPNAGVDLKTRTNAEAASVPIGTLVYNFAAGSFKKAQANAAGTADVAGMVYDASITNGASGQIATDGLVIATTGQWDAITGQTGGLTPLARYFLDPATSGRMTTTPPTTAGQFNVLLGTADSTTDFDLHIEPEIRL
jgi:hypothetical protein